MYQYKYIILPLERMGLRVAKIKVHDFECAARRAMCGSATSSGADTGLLRDVPDEPPVVEAQPRLQFMGDANSAFEIDQHHG